MSSQPRESAAPRPGDAEKHEQLREIFMTVTGTEEFVEEQAQEENVSHGVSGGDDRAEDVSAYVSSMVQADGLSDTLDEPSGDLPTD